MNDNKKFQKMPEFECKFCNFICFKNSNFQKHLSTDKHLLNKDMVIHGKSMVTKNAEPLICSCGKLYKYKSGLSRHKKICEKIPKNAENKNNTEYDNDTNIITKLLEQNSTLITQNLEFKQFILEQNKQIIELAKKNQSNITNNNCTNNTITNKFNLQVFLNEKCKDALNINQFIDTLNISFKDLENVGTLGYVEGISKIFLKGLKQLDVYKRPIHCSDLKRETMYIKQQNTWEKDSEEKNKLKMAIKNIAHKNTKLIPFWRDANPSCLNSESKKNDQYMKILYESMGPNLQEENDANYEKIISKVAKEVTIDKNIL
jgi:hypothetical protein